MPSELSPPTIGRRYHLRNQLGAGGMGDVYRTTDRLMGQSVALKSVLTSTGQSDSALDDSQADLRLALAQEFQVLASLRHPHIIGVLDYGFSLDATRRPYFTMELLENARTILEAGQEQALEVQIELLIQMLQALAYLHRRGIIHRDLKPSNVLAIDSPGPSQPGSQGRIVKLLDFGVSMAVERAGGTLGTLAYMAPEVLDGQPAGVAADLYAVGVMAYELLVGRHPFDTTRITSLVMDVMNTEPDVQSVGLKPQFAAILKRLLAKEPANRYADAGQVIEAFSLAAGQPLAPETEATRESFLQAAQLVGRETELDHLSNLLAQAIAGQGSAWLIGGESGVGKSRLLDELRPLASVQGALVLRGQSVSAGGNPYQLWRAMLRWLSLLTELDELEASVLKTLAPDLPTLLERDIPDAPELDPQAAQPRLLTVIEDLFRRYAKQQPVVIILEDLHWASSESLAVLTRLNRIVHKLPLLIIGSYRDDERPELAAVLPAMQLFKLNRLAGESIAQLSQSMLGQAGRQPELLDLLQRETEGNAFFLVEVVRALAEEAGRLDRVGQIELPERVFTGGVQRIIQHHLDQVPPADRPLLQAAAVLGRQLDLAALRLIEPGVDLEQWLTRCAEVAILNVQDDRWRFAHDKLRDGLLLDLAPLEHQALHRQAAEAIEAVYPTVSEQAAALAHHWGAAGDRAKESHYTTLAGEQALQSGAYQEAIGFLERALSLASQSEAEGGAGEASLTPRPVRLKRQLGEAHLGLGNMAESRSYLEQALAQLGWPIPKTRWQSWLNLGGQILRQTFHLLWPARFLGQASNKEILFEATRIGVRLGLIYYLERETMRLLNVGLRTLNLGEAAGPSPGLARSYANMCVIAGQVPLHRLARAYSRRARESVRNAPQLLSRAWVLTVTGVYSAGVGHWADAQEALEQAVEICGRLGDRRRWEESLSQLAMVHFLQGRFSRSLSLYNDVYHSALRRGDPQLQTWGLNGQARSLLALGQPPQDEALDLLKAAQHLLAQDVGPLSGINTYGALALAHLRRGETQLARQAVEQAFRLITQAPRSSYYILPGYTCATEVYLSLWEKELTNPPPDQPIAQNPPPITNIQNQKPKTKNPKSKIQNLKSNNPKSKIQNLKSNNPKSKIQNPKSNNPKSKIQNLKSYARVFPIGQPPAWLWQGLYDWLAGHPSRAYKAWQKSLVHARRLAMPYEQGLAHYEIGRHLAVDDPIRREQLTQACEIFARLEAAYDLERAQAALNDPGA